jgi:hypothetical protein
MCESRFRNHGPGQSPQHLWWAVQDTVQKEYNAHKSFSYDTNIFILKKYVNIVDNLICLFIGIHRDNKFYTIS